MTLALTSSSPRRVARATGAAWTVEPVLTFVALAAVVAFAATLAGLAIDRRAITGAPAWLKPAKFAISISIYSATLVWMLGFVKAHRRLARIAARVTAVMLAGELVVIVLQAARGTTSHYNMSTPLNNALWSSMGGMIVAVWLANLLAAVLLLRERDLDPTLAWGMRLGLGLSLVGMGTAFFMASHGGHTFGAADGGPGLPLVGWSTIAGDLRPAHFVGLHALQIMPLLGWLLMRTGTLSSGRRVALLMVAGFGYLGAIVLLTWQGLREQPLLSLDGLTLAVAGALAGAVAVAALAVMADARRPRAVEHRLVGAE